MPRNMWKLAGISVILFMASAYSAFAQCHVGAQIGSSLASAAISLPSVPASVDGLGARSRQPDFGLAAGCDFKVANSPFMVGAFGDYVWKDTAFSVGAGPLTFSGALGNQWTIGARAGYVLPSATPYLLVGYTRADMTYSIPIAGAPATMSGWTGGGGIEVPLNKLTSVAVEARYTRFQEQDLVAGLATIRADQLSAMVRLNINIGN